MTALLHLCCSCCEALFIVMTGSFFFLFSILMRFRGTSGVVGLSFASFRQASQQLKASYASSLRPHTLVAEGRIH